MVNESDRMKTIRELVNLGTAATTVSVGSKTNENRAGKSTNKEETNMDEACIPQS